MVQLFGNFKSDIKSAEVSGAHTVCHHQDCDPNDAEKISPDHREEQSAG